MILGSSRLPTVRQAPFYHQNVVIPYPRINLFYLASIGLANPPQQLSVTVCRVTRLLRSRISIVVDEILHDQKINKPLYWLIGKSAKKNPAPLPGISSEASAIPRTISSFLPFFRHASFQQFRRFFLLPLPKTNN